MNPDIEAVLILARLVQFASVVALVGTLAFGAYAGAAARVLAPRLRPWLILTAALVLASAGAWLMLDAASFLDDWHAALDPATLGAVLTQTSFGRVWIWRLGLAALALVLTLGPVGWQRDLSLGLVAAALAGTLGLVGHAAMETGGLGVFHRLNHALHLIAAGAWLGGLWPLALSLRLEPKLAALAVRRFSDVGVGAVVLILASGAVNSWFLIGSWAALATSQYGSVLILKLFCVLTMLVLAAINRLVLVGRIEAPGTTVQLSRRVTAELLLGFAILGAASLLGTLPPAGFGPGQ